MKIFFILCGLIVGIAATVALFMIVDSLRLALGDQIDEFGANIVIVPRAEGMEIGYGSTNISRVSIDLEQLKESDLEKIKTIPDYTSINIVSPKMVTAVQLAGQEVLLVGVEPNREFIMKPWFKLSDQSGLAPDQNPDDLGLLELPADSLIAGAEAARALGLKLGNQISANGTNFKVFGILEPLGSVEDGLFFGNSHISHLIEIEKFESIISNTIKILTFMLVGTVIFVEAEFIVKGTLLFLICLVVRFISVAILARKERFRPKHLIFMTLNIPKNIEVAVILLIVISLYSGVPHIQILINIMMLMMIYSIALASVASQFFKSFFDSHHVKEIKRH